MALLIPRGCWEFWGESEVNGERARLALAAFEEKGREIADPLRAAARLERIHEPVAGGPGTGQARRTRPSLRQGWTTRIRRINIRPIQTDSKGGSKRRIRSRNEMEQRIFQRHVRFGAVRSLS